MKKDNILEKITLIVQPFLNEVETDTVSENSLLVADLGLDSIDVVDIIIDIEDTFLIKFKEEELDGLKTVKNLLDIIIGKTKILENEI